MERWNEIEWITGDAWYVPASDLLTDRYVVRLGDNPSCECPDYTHRHRSCKHLFAAQIADAKSRTCDCCGARVLGRFLSEVTEDDGLLSWFPGDELCGDCVREGFGCRCDLRGDVACVAQGSCGGVAFKTIEVGPGSFGSGLRLFCCAVW
jgi:hypothetical protein